MAHYEPGRRVINLTRMSGAGALAHEWCHALDNYLGGWTAYLSEQIFEKGNSSPSGMDKFIFALKKESGLMSAPFFQEIALKNLKKNCQSIAQIARSSSYAKQLQEEFNSFFDELTDKLTEDFKTLWPEKSVEEKTVDYLLLRETSLPYAQDFENFKAQTAKEYFEHIEQNFGRSLDKIFTNSFAFQENTNHSLLFIRKHSELMIRRNVVSKVYPMLNIQDFKERVEARLAQWRETGDPIPSGYFLPDGNSAKVLYGKSTFFEHARMLDRTTRSSVYFAKPCELFARAGEACINDTLEERGIRSDYLVHGVDYSTPYGNPYPFGDERPKLNMTIAQIISEYHKEMELNPDAQPDPGSIASFCEP